MTSSASGQTLTFGKTTVGNITDTGDSNSVIAGRFRSGTQGGTAVSISVHAGAPVSAAPNNQFQVALYADNAGSPGTLIASSSSATLNASSWNTAAISAPISPSTWYWIAYNTNGTDTSANNITLSSGSIANQTQWIDTEPFGTWPAKYGPVGGTSTSQWDMYVTLTVGSATLVSIAVTPANPSIAKGTTQQFTATGTYSDGSTQNLTSSVTWSSTSTAVATINGTGLASGVTTGGTTINATSGTISGSTTLTVTPPTLVSIGVTPANPSIAKGTTQQFTATGTYSDGSTQNLTSSVTWSSTSTAVATISGSGLGSGVGAGSTTIQASLGAISGSTSLTVVTLPTRAQVLAAIEKVNDYWIPNNNIIVLPGEVPGNSDWDQATYFSGDLAAYDATGQANYLSFAQSWASQNNYSLIGGNTTTNADAQAAGQAYVRLYQLSNTASDVAGITESINGMVNSSVVNEWTWVDAINMSMPDFAELGSIYNNTNYYNKMYALYSYAKYSLGLYDSTTGLWWRDSTFVNTTTYWSRGNGWAFAAHAKVLSVLPKSDPHYAEYLSTFTTMAQALAARQQPGGYWDSGLGATDYPGPESSGTALFLYGLAWGLNTGVLDQNTYLPVVEKAWNFFVNTAIQPSGLLGYVQDSPACNCPGPTSATTTFDYGVGAFLLAAGQMAQITQ